MQAQVEGRTLERRGAAKEADVRMQQIVTDDD